jgi:hypothetical protein
MGKIPKVESELKNKKIATFQSSDQGIYECEHIVDLKFINGKRYYLVKWKNYTEADSTWEPL